MNSFDDLTRRRFVTNAARTYLGVSLAPLAAFAANNANANTKTGKATSVIFLNMRGGMSHIDTFDPKPKQKRVQGPVEVINSKADGIQLTEYLSNTAKLADKLCIINSMSSTQGAHEQGQYAMHRSYSPRSSTIHPTLGSWSLKTLGRMNKDLPGFVSIGGSPDQASAGFFGAKYAGVPIGKPEDGLQNIARSKTVDESSFQRRLALADVLNQNFHNKFKHPAISEYDDLFEEAIRIMQSKDLEAFDITKEPPAVRERYGKNHFGQGCLLARRLVENKVRFIEVTLNGWDTHYDNFTAVANRCATLDKAYAALLTDLSERGLLETTLVVLSTEFGRTPEIVKDRKLGRDHFPAAYSSVLAGGGVKGGIKYGKTNGKGEKVRENPVSPQMLNATIAHGLGLDPSNVLTSPSGRPFTIGNKAKPIKDIF